MLSKTSSTFFIVIVFLNLKQFDMKTVTGESTNTNTPTLLNKHFDLNNILNSMFPNFNNVGNRPDNFQSYPDNANHGNYPRFPETGSNWNNNNNWNNNRYPDYNPNGPSYPNVQALGIGNNYYNANGLQNNQIPNPIAFPGNQIQTQGVPQGQVFGQQSPGLNQGQPQYPQGALQNYYPGLQNDGSFNSQDSDGLNNQLPSGNFQKPLLQHPSDGSEIFTSTTEKVAILGYPVLISNVPSGTTSTSSAMKQCAQDCPSTSEYNPVCGSNNVTYFNEGKIGCARICGIDVTIARRGACTGVSSPGIFV